MIQVNIENIEKEFKEENTTITQLKQLIAEIEDNRILRFTADEISCKFRNLLDKGIVFKDGSIVNGKDIGIKTDPLFLYVFFEHFSKTLHFQISDDIDELLDFVDKVGDFLVATGNRAGITQLTKSLISFLVGLASVRYGADTHSYASKIQLVNKKDSRHQFFNEYVGYIGISVLRAADFWKIITHLALQIGGPKPGYIDLVWRQIENAVSQFCKNNPSEAIEIKNLSFAEVETPIMKELIFPVLVGCIEANVLNNNDLVILINDQKFSKHGLALLASTPPVDPNVRLSLFEKLKKANDWDTDTKIQVPRLLLALLLSEKEEFVEKRSDYIDEFNKHLLSDDQAIVNSCFYAVNTYNGDKDFFLTLINGLITSDHINDQNLQLVNSFFYSYTNTDGFFSFLRSLSLKIGFKFHFDLFEDALDFHRDANKVEFESQLLRMVIDDEGFVRWAGHEILFHQGSISEKINISTDLLSLGAVSQYKTIVSVVTPFQQVNQIIPFIVPLLASPYPVIVELLLSKLEELINSYKFEVIESLTEEISDSNPKKTEILQRLKNYFQTLVDELTLKVKIKELDPQYSQPALMRLYSEAFTKKSKKSYGTSMKKRNSIMDLVTKVTVARGGGFVMPGHREVTPLKRISVSWTMPRTMFIQPERMDYERFENFTNNWKEEYKQWEQIISSSGNI